MKIIRYRDSQNTIQYGCHQDDGSVFRAEGDPYTGITVTTETADIAKLLAPIEPTQILCIGLNYKHHAAESGMAAPERPVLFVKGINTLQHPGDPIEIPTHLASHEVDYECELAVVIGKPCKNVSREEALSYVAGYTCANDVSARDHQIKLGGGQWCRGKFFDTFAPLGPWLVTTDEITNPNNLKIATILNGERVQDWNTNDMIFDVATIISYLSGSTTLVPGTVIMTGTPHGVGMAAKPSPRWLRPGDKVAIEIEGIGTLHNPVAYESVKA
ncbi:fumarylacetoacetate hydrolase family protein [Actomonas aquatica]|uniref:Fumarylacetoacetate hydrolase family protein n=1 Tax=Actomonas aquatica TaxID=2866162 RepID=A0ABZ1CF17_9BACT|nr:fumarylacetoacetate hydrolase family protein [Opitutus sp. WL0086]WRQ90093.1 fumarylacetoacetate hydrolase family protein [Opitutus sp. WL0086]